MDQDAVHVHQVRLDRSLGGHAITRFRYGEDSVALSRAGHGQLCASSGSRARSRLGHPRAWRRPDPRATRRAGPPPLAVERQLLGVLAEGGDQLVLVHRRAAFELQLSGPLAELLEGALLIGAPVRRALLVGRVVLGRSLLAVVAERGDQLVLGHRGAAFELQLTRPLAELLDTALLIGA